MSELLWALFPPLLFLIYYYYRIPTAPSLVRVLLFFIFGIVAGLFSLGLEWVFETVANRIVDWEKIQHSVGGVALRQLLEVGSIEEGCKLLAVVIPTHNLQRRYRLRPITVFLFTIAVAIGFTAEENWVYLFNETASIFDRFISTPVHAMFSAPWGYTLGTSIWLHTNCYQHSSSELRTSKSQKTYFLPTPPYPHQRTRVPHSPLSPEETPNPSLPTPHSPLPLIKRGGHASPLKSGNPFSSRLRRETLLQRCFTTRRAPEFPTPLFQAWLNSVFCHALVNFLSSAWLYPQPLHLLVYGLFPFLLWMFWRLEQLLQKLLGKPPLTLITGRTPYMRYWQKGLVLFALMLGGNAVFGIFLLVKSVSLLSHLQLIQFRVLSSIFRHLLLNMFFGFLAWIIYRYLRQLARHRFL